MENAARVGEFLLAELKSLQTRHPAIGDVRGKGLMIAIELVKPGATSRPRPTRPNGWCRLVSIRACCFCGAARARCGCVRRWSSRRSRRKRRLAIIEERSSKWNNRSKDEGGRMQKSRSAFQDEPCTNSSSAVLV